MKQQLQDANQDTAKLRLYVHLSNNYVFSYPDTALQYAQKGLQLAQKINNPKWIAFNSLSIAQSFNVLGNYPTAIDIALKALRMFEKSRDTTGIIFSNLMISWAYRNVGDAKQGLRYSKKAKHYAKAANDSLSLLIAMEHITGEYERLDELDSALFYSNQLLDLQKELKADNWAGFYRTIAMVNLKTGQFDVALHYYRMTIEPSINSGIFVDLLDAYIGIAEIYYKKGIIDSSLFYADEVLKEYRSPPTLGTRFEAAILLVQIYQQYKKNDSAIKYLKLSMAFKDSLSKGEQAKDIQNIFLNEWYRKQEQQQQQLQYRNKIRTTMLIGGLIVLLLIAGLLWRNNQIKQKSNELLKQQKEKTEQAIEDLKAIQAQLIQAEKMASLGELTAGIAHEIQNPLNFVNNFSETNTELLQELKEELNSGDIQEAKVIATDIEENERKISQHGKRADAIVKAMMQHSRLGTGDLQSTDLNALAVEYFKLAYHGFRAKDKSFNATIETNFDESISTINIMPQDIGRVLLNLLNNAFYAVAQQQKQAGAGYESIVTVRTKKVQGKAEISVQDNGMGISKSIQDKIFQPFFTTKPTGEGAGLGLSLSYDIVKAHGGELKVESTVGEGSVFTIILPV